MSRLAAALATLEQANRQTYPTASAAADAIAQAWRDVIAALEARR